MHGLDLGLTTKLRAFGEMLVSQRKKRGVKQKELAELWGGSQKAKSA